MVDEHRAVLLQRLSLEIADAVYDVLKEMSMENPYHDLIALSAFYFRFKRDSVKALTDEAEAVGIKSDVEANLSSILKTLEQHIENEEAEAETEMPLPPVPPPSDEYGPH